MRKESDRDQDPGYGDDLAPAVEVCPGATSDSYPLQRIRAVSQVAASARINFACMHLVWPGYIRQIRGEGDNAVPLSGRAAILCDLGRIFSAPCPCLPPGRRATPSHGRQIRGQCHSFGAGLATGSIHQAAAGQIARTFVSYGDVHDRTRAFTSSRNLECASLVCWFASRSPT